MSAPDALAINAACDSPRPLTLQAAARRSYFYDGLLSGIGTVLSLSLALAAITAVLLAWPSANLIAALAAGWIFVSRAVLAPIAGRQRRLGARFQDKYDSLVLGTAESAVPEFGVVDEAEASRRSRRARMARYEGWYGVPPGITWPLSVYAAQIKNAAWGARQHRSYAILIVIFATFVGLSVVTLSLVMGLQLDRFLIELALPVLPLMLDLVDQAQVHFETAQRRQTLAVFIQDQSALGSVSAVSTVQEQLFAIRATMPHVPGWFYLLLRRSYERDISYSVTALFTQSP